MTFHEFKKKAANKIALCIQNHGRKLPDWLFLKIVFRLRMGYKLDLKQPKTFSEKIQWLKLNNRRLEYTQMVDKYAVKNYVGGLIGQEHIIPTLGVWDKAEDIEWEKLPERFVLKTTHGGGGGGVVICKDKKSIDRNAVTNKLKKCLEGDIYETFREWPYKDVPRRIIAEEYINPAPNTDLRDYKFFCFNGSVKCFKIDFDRQTDHHANYYDVKGNLLPFGEAAFPPVPSKRLEIPSSLSKMIELAEIIANGHPFLRVDFYDCRGKVLFGEMTFYPASGMGIFTSDDWDRKLGDLIRLPE